VTEKLSEKWRKYFERYISIDYPIDSDKVIKDFEALESENQELKHRLAEAEKLHYEKVKE